MRSYLFVFAIFGFFFTSLSLAHPQTGRTPSTDSQDPQNDSGITLRVTTREVLVDLIALDRHNQSVLDLKPAELQVLESPESETKKKRKKKEHRSNALPSIAAITSLSIVDPNSSPSSTDDAHTGFLWVKPPGANDWVLFNLNDYSPLP